MRFVQIGNWLVLNPDQISSIRAARDRNAVIIEMANGTRHELTGSVENTLLAIQTSHVMV